MQCRLFNQSILKPVIIGAALLSVTGCTSVDVASTRALNPDVGPLQKELHLQYSELALHELAEGNPVAAALYNDKALQAARGETVKPENPTDQITQNGFTTLMQLLQSTPGMVPPALVARAQVMYDCWLEERTENIDKSEIVACRQAFDAAVKVHEMALSVKGQ